jgi:hypothetical protein
MNEICNSHCWQIAAVKQCEKDRIISGDSSFGNLKLQWLIWLNGFFLCVAIVAKKSLNYIYIYEYGRQQEVKFTVGSFYAVTSKRISFRFNSVLKRCPNKASSNFEYKGERGYTKHGANWNTQIVIWTEFKNASIALCPLNFFVLYSPAVPYIFFELLQTNYYHETVELLKLLVKLTWKIWIFSNLVDGQRSCSYKIEFTNSKLRRITSQRQ